jgi:hypothetical protein
VNMMSKQSGTAERGWSPSLDVRWRLITYHVRKCHRGPQKNPLVRVDSTGSRESRWWVSFVAGTSKGTAKSGYLHGA